MVSNVRESAKATFRFKINGVVESLFVTDLSVTETISSYYFGSITLSTSKLIECIKSIPGKEAVLTIGANESDIEDRYFHGIVNEFKMSGKNGKHYMYHAQLVPRLWYLSLRRTCRIFQEMNVQDIVKEIIE